MKKLAIILTAAVMLFSTSSFAGPDKVSAHIKAAFQKAFTEAENVRWKQIDEFSFALFQINGADAEAAYNEKGELIAMSRDIELAQLPLSISTSLNRDYENYNLSDKVLELNFDGATYYYLTATNNKKSLKLKCDISGNIFVESKTKVKMNCK